MSMGNWHQQKKWRWEFHDLVHSQKKLLSCQKVSESTFAELWNLVKKKKKKRKSQPPEGGLVKKEALNCHPRLATMMRTAAYTLGASCKCQREQYRSYSQQTVVNAPIQNQSAKTWKYFFPQWLQAFKELSKHWLTTKLWNRFQWPRI